MTTMIIVATLLRVVVDMAVGPGTRRAIPRPAGWAGRNGADPAAAVGPMTIMTIGVVRPAVETTMMTIAADRGVVVMAVGSETRRAIPRPASVAGRNGVDPAAAVGPMTTMTIGV